MKLLLVLLAILFGAWLWRSGRSARRPPTPPTPPQPRAMIACALCGTHVPGDEALPGRGGHYCCAEHRQRAEA